MKSLASLQTRFNKKWTPEPFSGCWLWTGALNDERNKYGVIGFYPSQKMIYAHRASWMIHRGEIPIGLLVLHSCDTKECVNPGHLFLGTHKDNSQDMVRKGRAATGDRNASRLYPDKLRVGDNHPSRLYPEKLKRGENHPNSKLTENDIRAIRARHTLAAPLNLTIAKDYGVTAASIRLIVRREQWRHVA